MYMYTAINHIFCSYHSARLPELSIYVIFIDHHHTGCVLQYCTISVHICALSFIL